MKIFLWIVAVSNLLLAYAMLSTSHMGFFAFHAGIGIAAIVFATRKEKGSAKE